MDSVSVMEAIETLSYNIDGANSLVAIEEMTTELKGLLEKCQKKIMEKQVPTREP